MKFSSKPKQGLIYLVQLMLHVLFFSFTTNGASSNLAQLFFITHSFIPQCFVSNYYSKFISCFLTETHQNLLNMMCFRSCDQIMLFRTCWIWCVSRSCDQIIILYSHPVWLNYYLFITHYLVYLISTIWGHVTKLLFYHALFSLPYFYHLRSCD